MKYQQCIFLLLLLIILTTSFSTQKPVPKAIYIELVIPLNDSIEPKAEGLVLMDSILYYTNSALSNRYVAKSFRCYEEEYSSSYAFYQGINASDLNLISTYFRSQESSYKVKKNDHRKLRVCDVYGGLSFETTGTANIQKVAKKLLKLKGLSTRVRKLFSSWEELQTCD